MNPVDMAELSRFARGMPGLHPHIQPHPGYINPAAPFTLSGLNLNLGSSPAMPPPPPPPPQSILQAMSMPMNQPRSTTNQVMVTEQMIPGLANGVIPQGTDGGFTTDVVVGGTGIRYQNLDVEQLVERYWPGSYQM